MAFVLTKTLSEAYTITTMTIIIRHIQRAIRAI